MAVSALIRMMYLVEISFYLRVVQFKLLVNIQMVLLSQLAIRQQTAVICITDDRSTGTVSN